jgi:glycerophosphoryl diester phosphodiesterase
MKQVDVFLLLSLWIAAILTTTMGERLGNKQCGLIVPESVTSRLSNKIIIAHRGASFHLPEHTLAGYRLALELGADYIEPDLVVTKDGVLVACHSVDLNITTNVATVFPNRMAYSKASNRTGYWVHNFQLEEIKQLKVHQRIPDSRSTIYDAMFEIPTFQEILQFTQEWNSRIQPKLASAPKRAGVYAELKDPAWFQEDAQLDIADVFIKELVSSAYSSIIFNDTECAALKFNEYLTPPLVVQCFDGPTLQYIFDQWKMRGYGIPPHMVLLSNVEECLDDEWWYQVGGEWSHFIHGIGPDKACLLEEEPAQAFMEHAREHDLAVHVWTARPETSMLMSSATMNTLEDEMNYLFCQIGVNGLFTEDVGRTARFLAKGCSNTLTPLQPPSPSPSTIHGICDSSEKGRSQYLSTATGIMGFLLGILVTMFLMNSRYCKSHRHTRRQLRIPTHDDVEMI